MLGNEIKTFKTYDLKKKCKNYKILKYNKTTLKLFITDYILKQWYLIKILFTSFPHMNQIWSKFLINNNNVFFYVI